MKIAVLVPNVEMSECLLQQRLNYLKSNAQMQTEITMVKLDHGPISIESSLEHEMAGFFIAEKVNDLQERHDAFIIWCGEDAGLTSAREVAKVPVVGPLESSCALAITLGHRFSIIGTMVQKAFMERKLWGFGLGSRLASIRSLGVPVIQAQQDPGQVKKMLKMECEKAVKEDSTDVILFSCMVMTGFAREIAREIPLPIVDPALAALKTAEMQVAMGLAHSKSCYPFPPKSSGQRGL